MDIAWIDDSHQPHVEGDTLYVPRDRRGHNNLCLTQWYALGNLASVIPVVRINWDENCTWGDRGRVTKWVFFRDGQEITWDDIQDKIAVVKDFRGLPWQLSPHPNEVVPWGDDIETLVALERM